ncbi:hypothetical protein N0V82_005881 [Gnomoniopsis sp. IMI 355080]|nr:hypothetical protein N0V82_005881 [Gnomoniopsis sp. IMI 355080]
MSCAFRRMPCRLGRLAWPISSAASSTAPTIHRCAPTTANQFGLRFPLKIATRAFHSSQSTRTNETDDKARDLNQKGLDEAEQQVRVKQKQVERPWLRENADKPPAEQSPQESPNAQGKLLTTPTRLLKLIVPLPIGVEKDKDNNNSRDFARAVSANDTIQPLALLIHPQQPLSYVERLIQAELPPVLEDGKEKVPNIYFRAEDSAEDDDNAQHESDRRAHVESYSGLGHEADAKHATAEDEKNWVRWSSSTEMGDFIRDAARGREFVIEVEGYNLSMRVSVPSFNDRTYYLRMRMRRMSRQIDQLARIKAECDELAHKSAHRLAQGGFAALAGWWGVVYYVTFQTDAGWDLVEPVTYLVGLSTIMGGYLWFLYISKDLSYKAAMNVTVSRRQNALYESRGFDMQRWEHLVQDTNALRREIRTIASEYDVEWDEMKDLGGSKQVKKVLEKDRQKRGKTDEEEEEEEDEEDEAEADEEERRVKQEMKGKK